MVHEIDKDCTLALGDCVQKMGEMGDDIIDLLLTDPPYNLGLFMQGRATNLGALRKNHFAASNWDHIKQSEWEENMDQFFKQSARVLKKGGAAIVFVALIKVETIIKLAQKNGFYYKTTGIWHKTNPMPRNMNLHFVNSTEAWIYFVNGAKTSTFNNNGKVIHDYFESSVIGAREKKYGKHPTQKPVALLEHFIDLLSNEGERVLDPFMGSGSTGVAAIHKNRRFHGVEIEEGYYKIALQRITDLLKTPKLL